MIISIAKSCENSITYSNKNQSKNKLGYVYRHIRLDRNEVFYIGKGTNTNGRYSRAYSKDRVNPHWHNVVNKCEYRVEIMLEELSEEEVNKKEKYFIKLYGRRDLGTGTLVNMTDGGEGSSGAIRSEETRKKQSDANKGHKYCLGKKQTEEHITKRIKSNTGKKRTEESRKKMSDAKPKKRVGKYKDGILIKEYPSLTSTKLDGFILANVGDCCLGKRKTHGGYEWGYL